MHFGLDEDQVLLQETLRDFAAKTLAGSRLRDVFESGEGFDADVWSGAADVGLTGLCIPERYGGAELGVLELALAFEILGEAAVPGPFLSHALAGLALTLGGDDAQRERWLPRIASGECTATLALLEPDGGWEPSSWSVEARDGRLDGVKDFVEAGARAGLIVVGTRGGGLALIDRAAGGAATEPIDGVDRTRGLSRLRLEGAAVEPLGGGDALTARVLDAGRILLAADALGAAWQLLQTTVEYTRTREQFGMPIAQFQAVKHQLANLALELEPARGLFWYAGHAFDALPDEAPRAAAIAKAHLTDRAVDTARLCVELHGGIGFTWDSDVQIRVKRCMFDRMWLGGPDAHLERIAELGGW